MKYIQLIIASVFFVFVFSYAILPSPTSAQKSVSTGTPQYYPSPLPPDNACLNMLSEPDPLCQQGACTPTPDPYMCEDYNPCTVDSCYVLPIPAYVFSNGEYIENPYYTDPNWCAFGGYCYSTAHCTHTFSCPSPGFVCPRTYVTTGLFGHYVEAGACGLTPTPLVSATPTPTPTISVPCIPTMCLADEPLCGESTYGVDNCGISCSKDGDKCVSTPVPTISPSPVDSCLGGAIGCPSPSSSAGGSPSPTSSGGFATPSPVFSPTPTSSVVGNNPPTIFAIAIDQPNYCQVGLNITANVRWSFADIEGDSQQSYQVQIDTDPNFGSPDVDTGEIFSSTHATGFIGSGQLKYAQRYYTRVRARDTSGSLSSWY